MTVSLLSSILLAPANAIFASAEPRSTPASGPVLSSEGAPNTAWLSELPLTFPIQSAALAEYFNQVARPGDIAAFPEPFFGLLSHVTVGRRMAIFRSWAEAERVLPKLSGRVDLVAYNPEHWEHTPATEQQNLPATVRQASDFTRANGIGFVFVPDRHFAQAHLAEAAPFIDAVILQGQRLQNDPHAYEAWITEMTAAARSNNPNVQILAQVSATQGTLAQMLTAIQTVAGDVDGIAVWSLPRTQTVLEAFIDSLPSAEGAGPIIPTEKAPTRIAPPSRPTPPEERTVTNAPVPTAPATRQATFPPAASTIQAPPPFVAEEEVSPSRLGGVLLLTVGGAFSLLLGLAIWRRRDEL